MNKINLISTNKNKACLFTLIIIFFVFITLVLPSVIINFIPQSIIGTYFILNTNIFLISIFIFVPLYFIYTGIFIYRIKIDPYIIDISSFRSLSSLFYKKDYVDISHNMLREYSFFNRPFTLNKTLMIKIKTESNKIISKRFTLTLLNIDEENKLSQVLDNIILNNNK